MQAAARLALALAIASAAVAVPAGAERGPAADATLSVWRDGAWHEWWRAGSAPWRWAGPDPRLAGALEWRALADGLEWATLRLAGAAPAWRTRLVVARLDPARVRFSLELRLAAAGGRPAWSIDEAPRGALLAVNAGQFVQTLPWGWVVMDGRERLAAGEGPLARALAFDDAGRPRWLDGDSLRSPPRGIRTAFQSFPALLADDGEVPDALRGPGRGVDLAHRDARLAIGETRDGRLLVVLTRFDLLGGGAGALPLGPTTPEMAAIMGALGARDAMMLDGGISAQLQLRGSAGGRGHRWPGLRRVPLALLAWPREKPAERAAPVR